MDDQQEQQVATGLREGKIEAWQALYDAYAKRIWHSVARRMGALSADVADVVQETFLAAARSARAYDPVRGSLWLWLSGIARNHVALYYRKRRRHDRLADAERRPAVDNQQVVRWLDGRQEAPAQALVSTELAEVVRSTLSKLPADYETLLTAKYLDEVSVEQLAGDQKCSSTAIRSKLARARRAFRKAFRRASVRSPRRQASSLDRQPRGHDES